MVAIRFLLVLVVSAGMTATGCSSDDAGPTGSAGRSGAAGTGGSAASGGTGGAPGTAGQTGDGGAGGTGGTAGIPGSGGSGGKGGADGCLDDVGGRPAMAGQPSVVPASVTVGGNVVASVPVNATTKYVRAVVFSDLNIVAGSGNAMTSGGTVVEVTVSIEGDADPGDFYWLEFLLCTSESFCPPMGNTSVHYRNDSASNTVYFIKATDNGINLPAAAGLSDCAEIVPLTITN